MNDKNRGLVNKFTVTRNYDPDHKHDDCRYFVLDPVHDPLARTALAVYMSDARKAGYAALADDLLAWLRKIEHAPAADTEESDR